MWKQEEGEGKNLQQKHAAASLAGDVKDILRNKRKNDDDADDGVVVDNNELLLLVVEKTFEQLN